MFFAFSKKNNYFILKAPTREELENKIFDIEEYNPEYYRQLMKDGYGVVEANSLVEAKRKFIKLNQEGK